MKRHRLSRIYEEFVQEHPGRDLDRGGLRYHYLDEGEGEPVVMVHGNPTWSFYYRRLVEGLRSSYRTIVPDHIGCGLSDKPDDSRYDYTLESRIADLEALVEHLELDGGLTLVVHDWGGAVGLGYATRHPEQVARLVVLNTAAFHLPRTKTFPWPLWLCRDTPLGAYLVRGLNAFCRGTARVGCTRRPLPRDRPRRLLRPLRLVGAPDRRPPLRPGYSAPPGRPLIRPGHPDRGRPAEARRSADADRLGHEGLRLRSSLPGRVGPPLPRSGGPPLRPGRALRPGGRRRADRAAGAGVLIGPSGFAEGGLTALDDVDHDFVNIAAHLPQMAREPTVCAGRRLPRRPRPRGARPATRTGRSGSSTARAT